jgi:hypothetical protein
MSRFTLRRLDIVVESFSSKICSFSAVCLSIFSSLNGMLCFQLFLLILPIT